MILKTKPIEVTKDKISARESLPENCWRLAHDGAKALALFESTGYTWTRGNLFCATTEKECLDEIARLKLDYKPEAGKQPETIL